MVSAYTTLSSARSMGAQAASALQLPETMQSLELTPAGRLQFGDQCLREWGRNGKSPAGTSPEQCEGWNGGTGFDPSTTRPAMQAHPPTESLHEARYSGDGIENHPQSPAASSPSDGLSNLPAAP